MFRLFPLMLAFSFVFPAKGFAWGPLGHHTAAKIAQQNLSTETASKVAAILGQEGLSAVAVWADTVRGRPEWRHTGSYHYADLPDGQGYLGHLATLPQKEIERGDVIMAALKAITVLRDANTSMESKAYALKFLVHFIADFHQPLHMGRPEDKGGNNIIVRWYGKNLKLHALWDSALIDTAYSNEFSGMDPRAREDWYATQLQKRFPNVGGEDIDVLAWVSEGLPIRDEAYRGYEKSNASYLRKSMPGLELRLANGGYRLAAILNAVLGKSLRPSTSEKNFRSEINQITGRITRRNFEDFISLEPDQNATDKEPGTEFGPVDRDHRH